MLRHFDLLGRFVILAALLSLPEIFPKLRSDPPEGCLLEGVILKLIHLLRGCVFSSSSLCRFCCLRFSLLVNSGWPWGKDM